MAYTIYLCCVVVLGWSYENAKHNGDTIKAGWSVGYPAVYLNWSWPPVIVVTAAEMQHQRDAHRRRCLNEGWKLEGEACTSGP